MNPKIRCLKSPGGMLSRPFVSTSTSRCNLPLPGRVVETKILHRHKRSEEVGIEHDLLLDEGLDGLCRRKLTTRHFIDEVFLATRIAAAAKAVSADQSPAT